LACRECCPSARRCLTGARFGELRGLRVRDVVAVPFRVWR
jgi:hypothetical protein